MTSVPFAADEAPWAPAPGKVLRSELNPVDFLRRAAYVYPDKAAVVQGALRYSYAEAATWLAHKAGSRRGSGRAAGDKAADHWRFHA